MAYLTNFIVDSLTHTSGSYGLVHSDGLWEDLRFPAQGINPPGAASDPSRNTTDGLLEFSDSADNIVAGAAQMPHGWISESTISPHIHVASADATDPTSPNDKTRWTFDYKICDVGSAVPASYTTLTADDTMDAHVGSEPVHQLISLGTIAMTGFQDSCCILWKLTRKGSDGTNDTYPDVIRLIEFDIHYRVGTLGSINLGGEDY